MKKQKRNSGRLELLIKSLASKDCMIRLRTRKMLVSEGEAAVSSLARALKNSDKSQVRWEAAKALGAIGDIRSVPVLVQALEDKDSDVGWLAAKGLKKFKKAAWPPLMRALIKNRAKSLVLLQGAHHIMHNQKDKEYKDLLSVLDKNLEFNTMPEMTVASAQKILNRMNGK